MFFLVLGPWWVFKNVVKCVVVLMFALVEDGISEMLRDGDFAEDEVSGLMPESRLLCF